MRVMGIFKWWDRFLFEPVSPITISVFRILFGLLILGHCILYIPELENFFSDRGILTLRVAQDYSGMNRLNLFNILPPDFATAVVLMSVLLLAAVSLTVGFCSRLSALVVFVLITSFHHRNVIVLHSGDSLLRSISFVMIFAQSGAAFSVDRWIRIYRGREKPGPLQPKAPWAQRLIQIQLALVYIATFRWKIEGEFWIDGTAVYYASRLPECSRFPIPLLLTYLPLIKLMTWTTLLVEFACGILIWFRDIRYYVLVAGLLLHLGLEWSMNIPLFQWIMMFTLVTFIYPEHMQKAVDWLKRKLTKAEKTS